MLFAVISLGYPRIIPCLKVKKSKRVVPHYLRVCYLQDIHETWPLPITRAACSQIWFNFILIWISQCSHALKEIIIQILFLALWFPMLKCYKNRIKNTQKYAIILLWFMLLTIYWDQVSKALKCLLKTEIYIYIYWFVIAIIWLIWSKILGFQIDQIAITLFYYKTNITNYLWSKGCCNYGSAGTLTLGWDCLQIPGAKKTGITYRLCIFGSDYSLTETNLKTNQGKIFFVPKIVLVIVIWD